MRPKKLDAWAAVFAQVEKIIEPGHDSSSIASAYTDIRRTRMSTESIFALAIVVKEAYRAGVAHGRAHERRKVEGPDTGGARPL